MELCHIFQHHGKFALIATEIPAYAGMTLIVDRLLRTFCPNAPGGASKNSDFSVVVRRRRTQHRSV